MPDNPEQSARKTNAGNTTQADGKVTRASKEGGSKASAPAPKKKKVVQLCDFKLLKKLGQGGMGEVFLAKQVSLDRQVALKILSKEMAKKPGFVDRFVREARAMAKIDHPNAVKVYAAESDKGLNYVAIEFIGGQSMQDVMDVQGKLSIGDALHVILACADALSHAHEMTLIHRDIKPDNILVSKKGAVKVADFGLAKALDDADMSMTQSGTGLGTPLYMPPEQARDAKNVDHRTDIYALGCTLYYFVTGKLPFTGDNVLKLIIAKEKGQYDNARKLNSEVPERLDLMIDKMIQKDPKHRYATCAELITDIDNLGLDNETLSFLGDEAAAPGRSGRSRTRGSGLSVGGSTGPISGVSLPLYRTSAEDAEHAALQASAQDAGQWFVRYTNAKGEPQVKEMTTRQVQQGIQAGVLDVKSQAQRTDKKSGFLPLAAHPEFQQLMKSRLAKTTDDVRADHMKDMYAKLDKEHRSLNRWRRIKNFFGNILGGFSLIVYLILVAAVLYGGYYGITKFVYPFIKNWLDA